jgi:elongation factor Ts
MEYAALDVKKLREQTNATFADCKNALTEAKGWDEAVKILEAKSDRKAEKMIVAGRETKQGGVFSYVHHNHSVGVLLELNCSTDFVARSEGFQGLARDLVLQIAGIAPKYITFEEVPDDVVQAARQQVLEDESLARVPEEKREDVINSKLKKILSEQVLMLQPFIKDEAITISDLVRKVIAETGENIVVRRFSRFVLGE